MSTPAGLLRVILKRGNDKTFVDIDASAVKAGTLAELGETVRAALADAPRAAKPKAPKPASPPE